MANNDKGADGLTSSNRNADIASVDLKIVVEQSSRGISRLRDSEGLQLFSYLFLQCCQLSSF